MAVPDDADTELTIDGITIPRYSARGLTQTLEPIEATKVLKRTINGALHDLSLAQFQKYHSTITCTDQIPIELEGIFPGQQVTVQCVVGHKPSLTMMVVNYSLSFDEWGHFTAWSLELEEV